MMPKMIVAALSATAGMAAVVQAASAFDHGQDCRSAECYEKVRAPDVYATIERPVVLAPGHREIIHEPAVVLGRPHLVEIVPQRITAERIPPTYATVVRRRLVEPARAAYVHHPAVVERVRQTVVTDPGGVRWQRTTGPHGQERICKVHTAPVTRTVTRDVVVAPARRVAVMSPAVYRDVAVPVLVKPAHIRHTVSPAVSALEYRPVVLKPAAIRVIDHPPVVGLERHRVRVATGGFSWQRTRD